MTDSEYLIRFNTSHPVFAGHFPGHPVVPGACLVQIAQELLSDALQQPVRFTAVRNLKFRQTVLPDQEVTVTFRQTQDWTFNFQLSTFNLIHAQFAATYMCADTDLQ